MAIYKRPNSKYYWTKFYFEGQFIQQSTKCTAKKAAENFESALKTQLNFGRIGIDDLKNTKAKPFTFTDALSYFLDNIEVKESTLRRYKVASKALIEYFGKTPVVSISNVEVEKYRAWRKKQTKKAPTKVRARNPKARLSTIIAPATVNRELTLLSGLFKSLVRSGKVNENPVQGVTLLREENTQTRVVSDHDFRAYLMAASQPLRDVALLMFDTGMRPSEIFNLKKDDVDFAARRIRVVAGKTDAARRRLTMSDNAYDILFARYRKADAVLLFPGGKKGERDTPIIKLTNAHRAAIDRAKVRTFRLYDLRHTFATHLTQSGVDLMTVKAILGHSRLEMVQRYSHPTEQHQADAIQRLETFRNQSKLLKKATSFLNDSKGESALELVG